MLAARLQGQAGWLVHHLLEISSFNAFIKSKCECFQFFGSSPNTFKTADIPISLSSTLCWVITSKCFTTMPKKSTPRVSVALLTNDAAEPDISAFLIARYITHNATWFGLRCVSSRLYGLQTLVPKQEWLVFACTCVCSLCGSLSPLCSVPPKQNLRKFVFLTRQGALV